MRKTRYQENSNFINFSMMQSESGGKNAGLVAVDERWIASGRITNPDKFPSACRVENRDEKIIKLRFGLHKFKFHCNENRCVMNFWTNEMENEFWYLTPILYFAGGCKNTIEFFLVFRLGYSIECGNTNANVQCGFFFIPPEFLYANVWHFYWNFVGCFDTMNAFFMCKKSVA